MIKHVITFVIASAFAAVIVAPGCADFSSGECTDKALCDPNEAGAGDTTLDLNVGDKTPIDVVIDSLVGPDGDVPDGDCNGGVEDCSNGLDDNCDGKIDCADPVCQGAGYVCAPPPPSGWSGPVAFASATGGTVPSCGGAYATASSTGHDSINAPADSCGCSCPNAPTGATCNSVGISYYTDACITLAGQDSLPSFCVSFGSGNSYVQGNPTPTAYNGACTSSPNIGMTPVTWGNSYAACGYDGKMDTGGCTASALCVEGPSSAFAPKPCIYQTGDIACPGTPYTVKKTIYTSDSDTRGCSTCTCTASAGTCTATIDAYSAPSCGGSELTISTDNTCHAFAGESAIVSGSISVNVGTCGNGGTGTTPTGSATPTGPVTVCCQP